MFAIGTHAPSVVHRARTHAHKGTPECAPGISDPDLEQILFHLCVSGAAQGIVGPWVPGGQSRAAAP